MLREVTSEGKDCTVHHTFLLVFLSCFVPVSSGHTVFCSVIL
jgi:hypothetical protein